MGIVGLRLDVKFQEKEQAKQEGAKWNNDKKTWYIPFLSKYVNSEKKVELEKFIKWIPRSILLYDNSKKEYIGIKLIVEYMQSDEVEWYGAKFVSEGKSGTWYFPFCMENTGEKSTIENLADISTWLPKTCVIYTNERVKMHINEVFCCRCGQRMNMLQIDEVEMESGFRVDKNTNSYVTFAKENGVEMVLFNEDVLEKSPYSMYVCIGCGQVQNDSCFKREKKGSSIRKKTFYAIYDPEHDFWIEEKYEIEEKNYGNTGSSIECR